MKVEHMLLDYQAGETDTFLGSEVNQERKIFNQLVNKFEHELDLMYSNVQPCGKPAYRCTRSLSVHSDCSTLTSQTQRLSGQARRFGLAQGDLRDSEGR